MQIRILTSIATDRGTYRRGQVVTLPEETAREWVALGMAEAAEESLETATAAEYETTAARAPKRKGR